MVGEWRGMLAKLSFTRAWNAMKILLSFYLSRISGRPIIRGLPVSLSIEPTTSCNLRCPECPSGLRSFTRPTGMLDPALFRRVIDEQSATLFYLIFYFQGEPYLNPSFLDMVSYASSKKIYTATSTNAHFLSDENCRKTITSGLDRLIVSLDGVSESTYRSYRIGGDLQKVLEGARRMVAWRRKLQSQTPYLIFQFLVVKPNEHEIEAARELCKEIGFDEVRFKTAQVYDFQNGNPLIPDNQRYSRYIKNKDGSYRIKSALDNHCWKMWHSSVITWDGKVVPCCFDKDAHYVLGSVSGSGFSQVWHSAAYRNFRTSLLQGRSKMEMCKNCSEGTRVWA